MEGKDVKIPQFGKAAAKGIENAEQLDKVLDDGDKLAGKLADANKRIEELETQPEPEPEPEADNGKEPPAANANQQWGLGAVGVEERWQQDQMQGRGYETLVGTAREVARKHFEEATKPLLDEVQGLRSEVAELRAVDSWDSQIEEATVLFEKKDKTFMERHKNVITDMMKKKGNTPLKDNELLTELTKRYMAEDHPTGAVADEVAALKREGDFVEGESDGPTKGGYSLKGKTVKEMEESGALPIGDETKEIQEGE